MIKRVIFALIASAQLFSCSQRADDNQTDIDILNSTLTSESDSLAYIIGMSIGEQLIKMDSAINITLVSRAIVEQFERRAEMRLDEAKTQYLRYLLHIMPERKRGYEERYLSDLAKENRKYTRTKSGLTYNIEVIGDESLVPKSNNDWITIDYTIERLDGTVLLPKADSESEMEQMKAALSDLPKGVIESVKMIGKGGRIEVLIPSKLAYGEEGNEELGVEPIETLRYIIELIDMEKNVASKRKSELL